MTKKKLLAMILSVIMVCAMVVSFAACDKPTNDPSGNGGNEATPAQKYATLQKSWDDAKGEKSANDALSVELKLPFGDDFVTVTVEGEMTRSYLGSAVSEVSGKVTTVKVEGLSSILGTLGGFGLDLNKLIKKSGKTRDGEPYYETANGKLFYEEDPDSGEISYWYEDTPNDIFEDDANVSYKYIALLNSDNNIEFSDEDGLVSGTFTVDEDGAFAAAYNMAVLGMSMNGETEIDPEIVNMEDILGLMADFDISLDLDAISIYDLTTGDITMKGNNYQSAIKFSKATASILAQLDDLYETFMLGSLDNDLIDVYNGFADEQVSAAEVKKNIFDPARKMVRAFVKLFDAENLSGMLFELLTLSDSNVTIKPNGAGTKIKSVEGSQKATLKITADLIDDVIDVIDTEKIIETQNGLKEMKPFESEDGDTSNPLASFTVGGLIDMVEGLLFADGELGIVVTVSYKTALTY